MCDIDVFQLDVPHGELNLLHCLTSGQAFRWRLEHNGWWRGVFKGNLIGIRNANEGFECFTLPQPRNVALFNEYFRLNDDLLTIYARLAAMDEHLAELIDDFSGLRLLRQEPTETLLSFVCSAANSIPRISQAIEDLCRKFGRHIATWQGQDFYSFPEPTAIAEADETELAATGGLGFRGRNLKNVAKQILDHPTGWLDGLRVANYVEAQSQLVQLDGIGRKIADCVCLFSLDKDEAVPVDTHVRQLAARLFLPDLTAKTVTDKVYEQITNEFRERFGELAGWAQQFLYYEDVLLSKERRVSHKK